MVANARAMFSRVPVDSLPTVGCALTHTAEEPIVIINHYARPSAIQIRQQFVPIRIHDSPDPCPDELILRGVPMRAKRTDQPIAERVVVRIRPFRQVPLLVWPHKHSRVRLVKRPYVRNAKV
jgi:hypothetical protein